MAPVRDSPAKRWCFTWNNYSEADVLTVRSFFSSHCSYGVCGREVGESGTPHLQGFFSLNAKVRFAQLAGLLSNSPHFEQARGTPNDSRVYCSKGGDFFEHGSCPGGGGAVKSRDVLAVEYEAALSDPAKGIEVFKTDNPGSYAFSGHVLLRNYLASRRPCDRPDVRCRWFYGVPGVGKSRAAHDEFPDAFVKEPCTKWWSGYMLERQCIIDDFGKKGIGINHLLRWFDRYKCWVETKGGLVPLFVSDWIVTSNFHPREVYKEDDGSEHEQLGALLRRVEVVHFPVSIF